MNMLKVIEWLLAVGLSLAMVVGLWWFMTKPSIFTFEPILDIGGGEPLPRDIVTALAVFGISIMLVSHFLTRWFIERKELKLRERKA